MDTDGDLIADIFNLDDNCNIPDTVEGDEFLDTDGDEIPNRIDLHRDNDGIFDPVEAGHGNPNTNVDRRIDGAPSTFGARGLFNGIEWLRKNESLN